MAVGWLPGEDLSGQGTQSSAKKSKDSKSKSLFSHSLHALYSQDEGVIRDIKRRYALDGRVISSNLITESRSRPAWRFRTGCPCCAPSGCILSCPRMLPASCAPTSSLSWISGRCRNRRRQRRGRAAPPCCGSPSGRTLRQSRAEPEAACIDANRNNGLLVSGFHERVLIARGDVGVALELLDDLALVVVAAASRTFPCTGSLTPSSCRWKCRTQLPGTSRRPQSRSMCPRSRSRPALALRAR